MSEEKKKGVLKELEQRFEKIQDAIGILRDTLEEIYPERGYNELLDALTNFEFSDKKLSKKAKKEKEEKCISFLKKKYPKMVTLITDLDITLDSIDFLITQRLDKIEDIEDKISDIEELKEELERRKEELDY